MNFKVGDKIYIISGWNIYAGDGITNEVAVVNKVFEGIYGEVVYGIKIKGMPVFWVELDNAVLLEVYNSPLYQALREEE